MTKKVTILPKSIQKIINLPKGDYARYISLEEQKKNELIKRLEGEKKTYKEGLPIYFTDPEIENYNWGIDRCIAIIKEILK